MYIANIPNRSSPPAILLREGYRDGKTVKTRTLANLSHWPPERIDALRRALKGELDGIAGAHPISDRIYGVLFVLKQIAERLGLSKALGQSRMGALALFLVCARVAHQGSRLSAVRWAQDHAVAEVLGLASFDENDLYQALNWLDEHQTAIEERLYQTYLKQIGTPPVLVLYDVTSSYLEGQCNELAEFGYNRDGKRGKKQIVIGLLTADDGEPLAVRVFEGNSSDPTTVVAQITTLKERFGVNEVIFVGDRGMIKTKGKEALTEANFSYITALTDPQVGKLLREGILQIDLFDTTAQEVEYGDKRLILRCNEAVQTKEKRRRADKLRQLSELVNKRNAFVSESKRADAQAGLRQFNRWIKRYKLTRFVDLVLEGRELKVLVDEDKQRQTGLLDGCYVLETDVAKPKMDARTVDARYRDLQVVERNFRDMKTGMLEVRPIFLRKATRTRGHVFVAMLALNVLRAFTAALSEAFGTTDDDPHAMTVDDALSALSRLCLQRYVYDDIELLRLPQLDDRQHAIFAALNIRPPSTRPLAT